MYVAPRCVWLSLRPAASVASVAAQAETDIAGGARGGGSCCVLLRPVAFIASVAAPRTRAQPTTPGCAKGGVGIASTASHSVRSEEGALLRLTASQCVNRGAKGWGGALASHRIYCGAKGEAAAASHCASLHLLRREGDGAAASHSRRPLRRTAVDAIDSRRRETARNGASSCS